MTHTDNRPVTAVVPDLKALLGAVRGAAPLVRSHCHGEQHWKAVAFGGLVLAEEMPEVDPVVAFLFGLFHDSQREREGRDPLHGCRAADLAGCLQEPFLRLSPERLADLQDACRGHNGGRYPRNTTIGACWDADRLNLWRCGSMPDPARLCTRAARREWLIAEATEWHDMVFDWNDLHDWAFTLSRS